MQIKQMVLSVLSAAVLSGASGFALAQQPSKPAPGMQGEGRSMDHGMMGGGSMGGDMMGMMNMMHGCERMMGGSSGATLRMPPGNEKLEFQMRAEMMQKMGEIAGKYASQIKDSSRSPR
ncbi:MAG TPA: hypothetical protein VGJ74_21430 [Burkholderiales bacterium]|jgi:hypothetical protein